MTIGTHDGSFHADDVFAVAALRRLDPEAAVVRTRDTAELAGCDVRVDVGLRSDAGTGDFDHHQPGGAGDRGNGVPYASFGLVWRAHGVELCAGSDRVAAEVDERLVQGVDALDAGVSLTRSEIGSIRPATVSDVIGAMNPAWGEPSGADVLDARFEEAVALAAGVLDRQIALAAARESARALVVEAIGRAEDPRVIELDRRMPWFEPVVREAPEALYVVFPKRDGWGLQAVPRELGSFANRRDLPEAWAGLTGGDLAAVTGVADAVFCHPKRFVAAAESRDGVLGLVALALSEPTG